LNSKKCEFCSKELLIDNGDSNIISFCDDDCLQEYCKEYAQDYDSDREYEDRRYDLDWLDVHIVLTL